MDTPNTPSMPSLTPAQIISTVLGIVGLLVTQGIIDNQQEKLIGGLASIIVPVVWQLADAVIRHGRAKMHGTITAAHIAAKTPEIVTTHEV